MNFHSCLDIHWSSAIPRIAIQRFRLYRGKALDPRVSDPPPLVPVKKKKKIRGRYIFIKKNPRLKHLGKRQGAYDRLY